MVSESTVRDAFASVGLAAPAGFAGMLRDALRLVVTQPPVAAPGHLLTDAEREQLRQAGFRTDASARYPDAVARTAATMAAILADSITVADAADLLGVTPARIRQMLGDRGLVGVRTDEGWLVPRYQLADGQPVHGMRAVAQALPPTLHPVAVHAWLTTPSPALVLDDQPVSPLDWLRSGGPPDPVAAEAAAL